MTDPRPTGREHGAEMPRQAAARLPSMWQEYTDEQLVEAAKQSDSRAFETLMRRHNRRLFRAARSILCDACAAEDAVQEAYIRAFTNLSRYQPTGSFAAWLTRIAVNEALMLKRQPQHRLLSLDELAADPATEAKLSVDPLTLADDTEAASACQLLERAIDHLPLPFRMVFVLREVEQLSVAETAASLDLNEATVKTRLHRARRKLRADLSRRLRREQLRLFEFGGERCDRIVASVLTQLTQTSIATALV